MSTSTSILIVDDDATIREVLSLALADEGYTTITASDGSVALAQVASQPPALILLDLRMPIMDGWAFARAYRQMPPPHAPIIVLTAARDAAAYAADIAPTAVLPKPFNLDELIQVVSLYIQ